MTRTSIWVVVGLLALVTLSAAWFFENFDRVPSTRWEAPGAEARRDPYLALGRLIERLGRPFGNLHSDLDLNGLVPGGVLILDANRRLSINPKRAQKLLEWVEQGGYLIVAAELPGVDDPLVEHFAVQRNASETPDDEDEPDRSERSPCKPSKGADAVSYRLAIPGAARGLRVESDEGPWLAATTPEPVWGAGPAAECRWVLHYRSGHGAVTILRSLYFLTNGNIGGADHAALIWTLIRQQQPEDPVWMASRMEAGSLWEWLWRVAGPGVISAAVLLFAWLWATLPRFGGVLPEPEPSRRSLREHLAASGRAVWREGGIEPWVRVLRTAAREHLLHRQPGLMALDQDVRGERIAAIGGVPQAQIESLLQSTGDIPVEDFIELARAGQGLEQNL